MKSKSLVCACLIVIALTFSSTAFASGPRNNGGTSSGTGGGDGLGWLRNTIRAVAEAIGNILPAPNLIHESPHQ